MIDFHAKKETTINASPEAVFKIVSDLKGHKELAGSGELVDVRVLDSRAHQLRLDARGRRVHQYGRPTFRCERQVRYRHLRLP